jgi:hypothetical protein
MKSCGDNQIDVKAHIYYTDKDWVAKMESMGFELTPVDPFGGYVAPSKDADPKLEKAQETIRRRFQMEQ